MNDRQIKALGAIAQGLIRSLGYQAQNEIHKAHGSQPPYGEGYFHGEASDIQQAVDKLADPTLPENAPHA